MHAGTEFAAGFVDITPMRPVMLAGYGVRTGAYDGVADRLEANAIVLRGAGPPVVLVSFDLLYVGELLRGKLELALPEVPPDHLFLAASHTHFAPATDPTLPVLGLVADDYVTLIVERVATLVRQLLRGELRPLTLGTAECQADNAVNRRSVGWRVVKRFPFLRKGVWMQPNAAGMKDETVRIARLGGQALIWNYACHPVFIPRMNHVSADFVGQVRSALRAQFGAATAVLFWQGFSGNIYPSFASTMVGFPARIKRLLRKPASVDPTIWRDWADRLARQVVESAAQISLAEVRGGVQAARTTIALTDLVGPDAPDKRVTAHQVKIGSELHALGISAELVAEYGPLLRERLNNNRLICVGCIDGVFGYLPTARMLHEGGYEAGDFFPGFSLHGKFPSDIEERVQEKLLGGRLLGEPSSPTRRAELREEPDGFVCVTRPLTRLGSPGW